MARERHQPALEERAKSSTESRRRGTARTDPARESTAGQTSRRGTTYVTAIGGGCTYTGPSRPGEPCPGCGGEVVIIGRVIQFRRPETDERADDPARREPAPEQ